MSALLPRLGTVQTVAFTTRNSTYIFEWVTGEYWGVLTGIEGTYAGVKFPVAVEDVRDLVWVGEQPTLAVRGGRPLHLTRVISSTRHTWTVER